MAHRQIFSSGDYGPTSNRNYNTFRPMFQRHGVDVYLCGHDHSLQHIYNQTDRADLDYIISGCGGAFPYPYNELSEALLDSEYGMNLAYFHEDYGFASFSINSTDMHIQFYGYTSDTPVYEYTRHKN